MGCGVLDGSSAPRDLAQGAGRGWGEGGGGGEGGRVVWRGSQRPNSHAEARCPSVPGLTRRSPTIPTMLLCDDFSMRRRPPVDGPRSRRTGVGGAALAAAPLILLVMWAVLATAQTAVRGAAVNPPPRSLPARAEPCGPPLQQQAYFGLRCRWEVTAPLPPQCCCALLEPAPPSGSLLPGPPSASAAQDRGTRETDGEGERIRVAWRRCLPLFVVAGAMKAGTTALFGYGGALSLRAPSNAHSRPALDYAPCFTHSTCACHL